jgi:GntR family transcriptional regulator
MFTENFTALSCNHKKMVLRRAKSAPALAHFAPVTPLKPGVLLIRPTVYYDSSTLMIPSLHIEPTDPRPIWRQIEEGVQHLVASGTLAAGTPVPSVRDLARELQINPATVSKAYQRLTDAGVLCVRRGDGTYVAEAPPALPQETRERKLRDGAVRYAGLAVTLGGVEEEAVAFLREAWKSLKDGGAE